MGIFTSASSLSPGVNPTISELAEGPQDYQKELPVSLLGVSVQGPEGHSHGRRQSHQRPAVHFPATRGPPSFTFGPMFSRMLQRADDTFDE